MTGRSVILALTTASLTIFLLATPAAFATSPPQIDNESVSAITQTGAMLDTTIDPEGQATAYHFEYLSQRAFEEDEYTAATIVPVPDGRLEAIHGEIVEAQQITGLQPNTTYHYRVTTIPASQEAGEDHTFTTLPPLPPLATTLPAANIAQQSVTLIATIDSRGLPTAYEFDLGTDTGYGTRIFGTASQSAGAQPYTIAVQGLEPDTTYHYRPQATNPYGTTYGTDQAFTTTAYPTITLTAPPSAPLIPTPLITPPPTHTTPTHTTKTTRHAKRPAGKHTPKHAGRKRG
jgi:phosphodiesterase/alkaline phosphatase D-like protein